MKNKASGRRSATYKTVADHHPRLLSLPAGDSARHGTTRASGRKKTYNATRKDDWYWEMTILELQRQEKKFALDGLRQGLLDLNQQLSLAGLHRRSNVEKWLSEIVKSSSKQDREKARMATIALDALAEHHSAQERIAAAKWSDAFKAAVAFGRCIGRLEERVANAASRRGKGAIRTALREAYLEWKEDHSEKKSPKFDSQAAMGYSEKLRRSGASSLVNMISELKAEERRHAAWLKVRRGVPKHLLLASVEDFDGKFFSGEGFP